MNTKITLTPNEKINPFSKNANSSAIINDAEIDPESLENLYSTGKLKFTSVHEIPANVEYMLNIDLPTQTIKSKAVKLVYCSDTENQHVNEIVLKFRTIQIIDKLDPTKKMLQRAYLDYND